MQASGIVHKSNRKRKNEKENVNYFMVFLSMNVGLKYQVDKFK